MTKAGLRPKPAVFSGFRDCSTPIPVMSAWWPLRSDAGSRAPTVRLRIWWRRRLPIGSWLTLTAAFDLMNEGAERVPLHRGRGPRFAVSAVLGLFDRDRERW